MDGSAQGEQMMPFDEWLLREGVIDVCGGVLLFTMPGFPKPFKIGHEKFWSRIELQDWMDKTRDKENR